MIGEDAGVDCDGDGFGMSFASCVCDEEGADSEVAGTALCLLLGELLK